MKKLLITTAIVASITALYGCDQQKSYTSSTDKTVGQKLDKAIEKTSNYVDDATITAAVKTELAKAQEISSMQINVETKDGHVNLSGNLPSKALVDKARSIASSVKDVKDVSSTIVIEEGVIDKTKQGLETTSKAITQDASALWSDTEQTAADMKIAALIKSEAFKDDEISVLDIKTHVKDGHVVLSGSVPSEHAKDKIIMNVKAIEGVKSVEDHLEILAKT